MRVASHGGQAIELGSRFVEPTAEIIEQVAVFRDV
jgi:hypothetical protein